METALDHRTGWERYVISWHAEEAREFIDARAFEFDEVAGFREQGRDVAG